MRHFYPLNKLNLIFFALLLWQQAAFAAPLQVTKAPEPAWVLKVPSRTKTSINPAHVNGGTLTLLQSSQYEVAQEEHYYHNIYKILSEEGVQDNSEIRITFDPNHEKLLYHQVTVWRQGKPIDKLDLNKVKVLQREQGLDQYIYDDNLTATLVLDDIRVGDVIEYACTIKGANPVFQGKFFTSFNLQGYDPMDELLVRVVVPQQRKLHYKLYRTDLKPDIATADGHTTYTWHRTHVPGTEVDAETPAWFDSYPGVYLSEFGSWREVAQWAAPMYDLEQKPGAALQTKIDSIKSAFGSDEGRLEATLRFVQDQVRYLGFEAGIGGYKPRTPSSVFSQRLGDCKDKALLLSVMLHRLGIEAHPALVNSSYRGHVQEQLPSPGAFDHCIVQVKLLSGKTYWYDATISKQRGSYRTIATPNYGQALVLAPHTAGLTAVTAPAPAEPQVKVRELFYIDSLGAPVRLEVRTEYRSAQADYQRSYFASSSIRDIQKDYLNFYAKTYPEIETDGEVTYLDQPNINLFTVTEKYSIPGFWEPQQEHPKVLECGFYPQVLQGYLSRPQESKRTMPLALTYPLHIEEKMTLLLPSAWPVDNSTETITDSAFTFTKDIAYSRTGTELNVTYTYQTRQDHVKARSTATYLKNLNRMYDQLGYGLTQDTSVTGGGGSSSKTGNFSWTMFVLAVFAFCGAAFGAYKLYHWDPQPADGYSLLDGQNIGGWLALVALGVTVSPLGVLINLATNNYFDKQVWANMLDAGSATFSPALAVLVLAEMVFNIALLVYSLVLIYLFFMRRTSVPRLMVIFYGFSLVFILAEYLAMSLLHLPLPDGTPRDVARAFFAAIIWIPYFLRSRRVKATFVEQLHPAPLELAEPEEVGYADGEAIH